MRVVVSTIRALNWFQVISCVPGCPAAKAELVVAVEKNLVFGFDCVQGSLTNGALSVVRVNCDMFVSEIVPVSSLGLREGARHR